MTGGAWKGHIQCSWKQITNWDFYYKNLKMQVFRCPPATDGRAGMFMYILCVWDQSFVSLDLPTADTVFRFLLSASAGPPKPAAPLCLPTSTCLTRTQNSALLGVGLISPSSCLHAPGKRRGEERFPWKRPPIKTFKTNNQNGRRLRLKLNGIAAPSTWTLRWVDGWGSLLHLPNKDWQQCKTGLFLEH